MNTGENESINEELRKWIEEHKDIETAEPDEGAGDKRAKEITGRCEICGARDAKYRCLKCGRMVCPSCYWIMLGVCKKCVSSDMAKKLEGHKDFGIDRIK